LVGALVGALVGGRSWENDIVAEFGSGVGQVL
jgi:hypothetical protein